MDTEKGRAYEIWVKGTMAVTITVFMLLAIAFIPLTINIDPLFHYHAPLENYAYPIISERYQNDGIVRNFEYDSIITGTSMTENFKVSEADQIFHAKFIKVPFSGGLYKEINDNLKRAYEAGKDIRYVIRGLDCNVLVTEKNAYRKDVDYPTYLYNNNLLDDLNYVWNKDILINYTWNVISYTKAGNKTTDFDDYVNWNAYFEFGAEAVLKDYRFKKKDVEERELTEEECTIIVENIQQNVIELAREHPETTFYLFFPPYSICYWGNLQNKGKVNWQIDAEKTAIEEMLKIPNIKLYSFYNNFELVCDLNNYKDVAHYGEWVNSQILEWMWEDEYLLTEENYREYIETIRRFYNSYDYESLYEKE